MKKICAHIALLSNLHSLASWAGLQKRSTDVRVVVQRLEIFHDIRLLGVWASVSSGFRRLCTLVVRSVNKNASVHVAACVAVHTRKNHHLKRRITAHKVNFEPSLLSPAVFSVVLTLCVAVLCAETAFLSVHTSRTGTLMCLGTRRTPGCKCRGLDR